MRRFQVTGFRPPLASLTAFALLAAAPVPREPVSGHVEIADDNTLQIGPERIRLYGIHTPESRWPCNNRSGEARENCGLVARAELRGHIGKAPIMCLPVDRDREQLLVARCYLNNEDLNGWIVANGWALADRTSTDEYAAKQQIAQAERFGIWSTELGAPNGRRGRE